MKPKYDKIGINYNLTRKADPFLAKKLLQHLRPFEGGIYLDIGCGTGNYTHALQKEGLHFIGIDPSKEMLDKARQKNPEIDWQIGTAEHIKLPNNAVDGIMASLTIHHWTDLNRAFSELHRVLKPKGRIVIFTSTPQQMKGYWLNHYFPKMLASSIVQMPELDRIENALKNNHVNLLPTEKYFIQPDLQDQFLYCGKQKPELYFNEQIRQGISSFSALANQSEVEQGLLELQKDVESGKIQEIMATYENELGDYLFVIGENE